MKLAKQVYNRNCGQRDYSQYVNEKAVGKTTGLGSYYAN